MSKVSSKLIRIPATPLGIFDTVKLRLDRLPEESDLSDLRADSQWKMRSGARGPSCLHKQSGLRVICYDTIVMVEASIPRVLGLTSDDQHHVRVCDLMEALSRMKMCLPRTADKALQSGQDWFAIRLDLAKNFRRPEGDVMEAVRLLKFPLVKPGATLFDNSGVAFYGSNLDLVFYHTDKRPPRGRLQRELRHQKFDRTRVDQVRAELRFKSPRALNRLVEHLDPDPCGLPVGLRLHAGDPITIKRVKVDYHRLQQVLATHIDSLTATLPDLGENRATAGVFRAHALANHPALWPAAVSRLSDRQVRNIRKEVARAMLRNSGTRLVEVVWDRPRISPELRRRMIDRMKEDWGVAAS